MVINQDIVGIVVLIVVIVVGVLTDDPNDPDRGSIDVWGQDHSLDK